MNRNQRKYYGTAKKEKVPDDPVTKNELVEVFPPKNRRKEAKADDILRVNRCCSVSPSQLKLQQLTARHITNSRGDNLCPKVVLKKKDPPVPKLEKKGDNLCPKIILKNKDTPVPKLVKKVSIAKAEKSSQYETPERSLFYILGEENKVTAFNKSVNVGSFIQGDKDRSNTYPPLENICITNKPRIKIIAEKYTKVKKKNVELRHLEEKIVCTEYDVYNDDNFDSPVQTMRVYFSVKPDTTKENTVATLPSVIKKQFNITNDSPNFDTEIFILDDKIDKNRPYIDDIKVLKRKYVSHKKKNIFDLMSLYEMAREGRTLAKSISNIISKTKLEEIKNLILKSPSSIHGLSRRTIRTDADGETDKPRESYKSESLFSEFARNE